MSGYAIAGAELVKFLIMLALQEARRSKMSEEETNNAFVNARNEFNSLNPDDIPDV